VDRAPADPAVRAAQDRAAQVDRVGLVIRVIPGDMSRVAGTADTGRAATTRVDPADMTQADPVATTRVDRAVTTRVGLVDLANPADTIPANPAVTILVDPKVTTLVNPGDMTRERPRVQSQADLAPPGDTIPADPAMPADTTPVGRALLARMPMRRPPTATPPLRMQARLHPTRAERRIRAERQTPVERRWDRTQVEVTTRPEALTRAAAARPADRTLRLEAIRPAGATRRRT
jgi:hypothetical protein